ncbi:DUF2231 domain-containing protein [Streptomyces sp. NPDC049944]|uniref:DUF2231 domain-containing protein n=1 Tax=Streptomyces sp. NPDC049944 TaxID=3155657 RepID=UPI00344906EC
MGLETRPGSVPARSARAPPRGDPGFPRHTGPAHTCPALHPNPAPTAKEPPVGLDLINGIPAHVLLAHIVVVLVPLTALALVLCAIWPSVMRRFGLALPALALVSLISVPLTTHAGEWLDRHVDSDALVRKHTELGDELIPWAIALFLATAAVWWFYRRATLRTPDAPESTSGTVATPLRITAAALSLVIGVGAGVQVYRIGDSGAKAAWHDGYSATAHPDHGSYAPAAMPPAKDRARSVRHAPSVLLAVRTEQARPVAVERTARACTATSRNRHDSGTAARVGDSGVYAARAAGGVMMASYSTGVNRTRRL